ncbi:MAG: hypothetical protein ACI4MK_11360, partial [Aristaeellaceae bacterium]
KEKERALARATGKGTPHPAGRKVFLSEHRAKSLHPFSGECALAAPSHQKSSLFNFRQKTSARACTASWFLLQ